MRLLCAVALAVCSGCAGRSPAMPPTSGEGPPNEDPAALSNDPIRNAEDVIRHQIHPGARDCYQHGLESDPTQEGRVVFTLKIAPNGDVASVTVRRDEGISKALADCMAVVAGQARFDPPGPKGAQITVPLNFKKSR